MVVVDQYNHRVNVYTNEGNFRYPTVVARIANNQIAVVDDDHSRIQIEDLKSGGEFLSEWDDSALEYLLIGRVARFGKRRVAISDFRSRQTVDAQSGRFLYWLKDSDEIFASLQDLFVIDENRLFAFDTEDHLPLLERVFSVSADPPIFLGR